ncbi:MAG: PilZ domain-containing protein [Dissulfurimicrobium hydrothermale]|uniref:PilZ domain-containing protein n=2 Tax=Dissulfurimicrobium TaxID=1769732 RepID=UPI003C78CBDF
MNERRKTQRHPLHLRVYFPSQDILGHTSNISLYGCFVETEVPIDEGEAMDMLIELPVIGPIPLKGYIQHKNGEKTGIGMQFVQVRFAQEESEYFNIYQQFIKLMSQLEKIRESYLELVQKGAVKLHAMPQKK